MFIYSSMYLFSAIHSRFGNINYIILELYNFDYKLYFSMIFRRTRFFSDSNSVELNVVLYHIYFYTNKYVTII